MTAAEWVRATLAYTPADLVPTPRAVLEELAASQSGSRTDAEQGSAPGGDFTAADLRARYRRSASWIRERFAAGDFGEGYRHGRDRVARREDVLAYDARQREGKEAEGPGLRRARRPETGLSLVERRRKAG